MNIGKSIKLCRENRQLSQKELAEKSDISKAHISLIENGKRDPSFTTIEAIAEVLDIPASIIVFLAAEGEELAGDLDENDVNRLSELLIKLIENSFE